MEHRRTLVRFENVAKSYDGITTVLDDLNLEIFEGEFLTLLGPSGSGKTTCLMMLAGFEFPSTGDIWLGDSRVNTVPPHKRGIGVVFQNYALFPHLSVADNVAYPLTARKMPKAEQKLAVARALDMVQMSSFATRRPGSLSGGQQQRVALARALVFNPRLVLLDEPLGALDKRLREHMQIELKEIHRKLGITFVYVTHDQTEALTMSTRVAVFDRGRIQQVDNVRSLYERPGNGIVANFVGDNNLFRGTVQAFDGEWCEIALPTGERLIGVPSGSVRAGQEVSACVRPERISILPQDRIATGEGKENVICVQARDRIYFGDHQRFTFRHHDDQLRFVKVSLDDPATEGIVGGSDLLLTFSKHHLHVFA
jgi:putative spermidine/putrescine transport system ATP-binding protein